MRLESYRRRALFTNLGVDIAQLPATQSIDFVPLERRYVLAQFVLGVVWMIVIAMVVFAAVWLFLPEEWRRGLSILLVLPVFPVLTYLSCRRCGYALREHDIALRKGIFGASKSSNPLCGCNTLRWPEVRSISIWSWRVCVSLAPAPKPRHSQSLV